MSRPIKTILKIAGFALTLVLLLWIGVAAYVTINKKELLATVTSELNSGINGQLTIESMEPALIQGFPGVSVSLKNVLLRDTLYKKHGHNLLKAKEIFLSLNVFSLLQGNTTIQKLKINGGKIYLFTDKDGKSNNTIFTEGSNNKKDGGGKRKRIKRITFKNVSFIQENQQRNKYFNFDIKSLNARIDYTARGWNGDVTLNTKVNSLAFNRKRGSFIQHQVVKADLEMSYTDASGILKIPLQGITIGEEDIKVGGTFRSTPSASDFKLSIVAPDIELKNLVPLFAKNISSKMTMYKLKNPFSAEAVIQGSLKRKGDPKIVASWKVADNDLTISGERIRNCSFSGYFNNHYKNAKGFNDRNSIIGFSNLRGTYFNIPFRAETIKILDLKKPIFEGRFQSAFALQKLNAVSGSQSFRFHKGTANLNLLYRAPYNKSNSTEPYIYGTLSIAGATVAYVPRNLTFTNIKGLFRFRGQDLLLQNLQARTGTNSFVMQGSMINFLNLYYTDPKRIRLDWHVKSPQLNLGELLAFLGRRKSSRTVTKKPADRVFGQLDKVLEEANVHLDVQADKLVYRRFTASKVHSSILLKQSGIELQDVSLNHAEGRLQIKGNIDQSGPVNRFNVDTRIINVNLPKLFHAFENFGQDAIAYQNLRGTFNSTTKISGAMRENGQIVPKSFNGTVSFEIRNGALLNFEPMQKVGNFAFPNRNFSNITFTRLKNTFDIKGNMVTIRPMYIESSVLNVFIEGVYGMPTGTDIALRIPLRNPKRDIGLSDSLKRKRFDNGIVINLRGRDDENGNVKFKMGKKDEEEDSEEAEKELVKAEKEKQRDLRRALRRQEKDAQ